MGNWKMFLNYVNFVKLTKNSRSISGIYNRKIKFSKIFSFFWGQKKKIVEKNRCIGAV
jgi:hypothetical protein